MIYLFILITIYFAVNSFMAGSHFNDFHVPGVKRRVQYIWTGIAVLFGIPILLFELVMNLFDKDKS